MNLYYRNTHYGDEVMVAGLGLEPRLTGPEPAVLPLDDPAIKRTNVDKSLIHSRNFGNHHGGTTVHLPYHNDHHKTCDDNIITHALMAKMTECAKIPPSRFNRINVYGNKSANIM